MSRSPEQHNRRPVALTPEARPRRRRVYFALVTKGKADAIFACVECAVSICSIVVLVYCGFTGLFRAWLGGQAVSGWFLAMAISSTFWLPVFVSICRCAFCYVREGKKVRVDKAVADKAALPELLREV